MSFTAKDMHSELLNVILYDYFNFYMSGEYKTFFDDDKGNKCRDAVEVLATEWFDFDFEISEYQEKIRKLCSKIDIDDIVKTDLCDTYKFIKTQNPNHLIDAGLYQRVAKAIKTLLKHDFHMRKEEIKSLVKGNDND